jgi:hypothetical protein
MNASPSLSTLKNPTSHPGETPVAPNDEPVWEPVLAARTRTIDALAGFETMANHAEAEFAPTVEAYRDLHREWTEHGGHAGRFLFATVSRPSRTAALVTATR